MILIYKNNVSMDGPLLMSFQSEISVSNSTGIVWMGLSCVFVVQSWTSCWRGENFILGLISSVYSVHCLFIYSHFSRTWTALDMMSLFHSI